MCELLQLRGDERILDVGTGSGYHAALLAQLGAHVWSVERHAALSEQAPAQPRARPGSTTSRWWSATAPAACPSTRPSTRSTSPPRRAPTSRRALEEQLGVGGRLVVPVEHGDQRLVVVQRTPEGLERTGLERVRFVPLVAG